MHHTHHPSTDHRSSVGFAYVPALDGLRGCAILLVMIYHAFPALLHGGFLGVELFFVLSGFLITALLLNEWERYGSISLPYFYMRRVIRLLPALIVLLCTVTVVEMLVFPASGQGRTTLGDAALSLGYVMNWARAFGWVNQSLFGHTWSLSIEEQFYLLWPVVVLMLCRSGDSRQIARRLMTAAGFLALYRTSLVVAEATPQRLYNGLDTRADGLLMGSALAAALHAGLIDAGSQEIRQRIRRWLPLSLAGLAVSALLANWQHPATYFLYLPLTVVSSTVLIGCVYVADETSRVRRMLDGAILVGIGRISYGLYLWHYPVYRMLGRSGVEPIETAAIGTALAFALAMLSWRFVECPMLRLKRRFSPSAARRAVHDGQGISLHP